MIYVGKRIKKLKFYFRLDKIVITTNSITCIIATDNWIIKVMPYKILVAHQSDTALIVNKSDTHDMSPVTRGEVQFINIEVYFIHFKLFLPKSNIMNPIVSSILLMLL